MQGVSSQGPAVHLIDTCLPTGREGVKSMLTAANSIVSSESRRGFPLSRSCPTGKARAASRSRALASAVAAWVVVSSAAILLLAHFRVAALHLVRGNVLDVMPDVPLVTEGIAHPPRPFAVELIFGLDD